MNIGDGFPILLADCPWDYANNQNNDPARGGITYPQMSMNDLFEMRPLIDQVVAKDSIMFSWTTFPKLKEGIELMEAWGYEYTTVGFVWVKLNPKGKLITPDKNMIVMNSPGAQDGFRITTKDIVLQGGVRSGQGYYTNANAEIVLVGKRGKAASLRVDKSIKQVVFDEGETIIAPITDHSAKPEEVRQRIMKLTGNIPGLELFARPPAREKGWVKLGGEIDNEDIRVMLQRLIDGEYRRPKNG